MKTPLVIVSAVIGAAGCVLLAAQGSEQAATDAPDTANRAKLRQFYGAPPMMPHPVTSRGSRECLHCHKAVLKLGSRTSVQTPHPQFYNCTQCHVGVQGFLNEGLEVDPPATSWQGLEEPTDGEQTHAFGPPSMPHTTWMRENCNSCHNPEHPNQAMRGPHPDWSNCRQCHVVDKANDF